MVSIADVVILSFVGLSAYALAVAGGFLPKRDLGSLFGSRDIGDDAKDEWDEHFKHQEKAYRRFSELSAKHPGKSNQELFEMAGVLTTSPHDKWDR